MQNNQLPTKFPIPFGNNAAAGTIRTVPTASQINIQGGAASLTDGFPPVTGLPVGSGGIPPFQQDFNGLFNQITAWNRWQSAGGAVYFDGTFATAIGGYPRGAVLASVSTIGNFWLNTVDNNVTDPEGSNPSGWTFFQIFTNATFAPIIKPLLPLGLGAHGLPQTFLDQQFNQVTSWSAVDKNTFSTSTFSNGIFTVGSGEGGLYAAAINLYGLSPTPPHALTVQFTKNDGETVTAKPSGAIPNNVAATGQTFSSNNDVHFFSFSTSIFLGAGDVLKTWIYYSTLNVSPGVADGNFTTDFKTSTVIARLVSG